MDVRLIAYTQMPLLTTSVAAARCYSAEDNAELYTEYADKDYDELDTYINRVLNVGHTSPVEHASFTFMIEDVSRAFLAQITRHRLASFSVQSQRYVRMDFGGKWYIVPPTIAADEKSFALFNETMFNCAESYCKLCDRLMELGRTKEQAQEDARFVMPEATGTKMVVTMNTRELLHFFSLRCCNRAQWEIRTVANKMLELVKEECPGLFKNAGPTCAVTGKCPEGKRGCGNPYPKE